MTKNTYFYEHFHSPSRSVILDIPVISTSHQKIKPAHNIHRRAFYFYESE